MESLLARPHKVSNKVSMNINYTHKHNLVLIMHHIYLFNDGKLKKKHRITIVSHHGIVPQAVCVEASAYIIEF